MFWSVVYLALRRIFQLVVLALRHDRAKEIEILVLRHQIAVLQGIKSPLRRVSRGAGR
jgi:putative transposase